MSERKLARLVVLDDVSPHPNADALDIATIGGWRVVAQKGLYVTGDVACYFEIDSWIPTEIAAFLSKGKEPKVFEGVKGERLKTIRLRGELSQGLLIPVKELPCAAELNEFIGEFMSTGDTTEELCDGSDLTKVLGILKYEKPVNANLAGLAKGNFPHFLRKSDQERIQNIKRQFDDAVTNGEVFDATIKLDGSSFTAYVRNYDDEVSIGLCSRNLELKFEGNEGNLFVQTFEKYNLEIKLDAYAARTGRSIAIQGEMVGPGIQNNFEGLDEIKLFVYNVFDIDAQEFLLPGEAREICEELRLEMVPTYNTALQFIGSTVEAVLALADGPSGLNGKFREGLVFKARTRHFQFKAISNRYLLKSAE